MWLGSFNTPRQTQATLHGIPDGMGGAIATLKAMRQYVRDAIRDPHQQIRQLALDIVGDAGWVGQARAIQQWVQDNIRYIRDPIDSDGGVELVQTPEKTLADQAGDCDDQATLVAALLSSLGHPSRFIAVWFSDPNDGHVLSQTLIGQQWVGVETIQPRPLGWFPPGVTSHYILKV